MASRLQRRVNTAMNYAMKCRGAPYGWWRGGGIPKNAPAYWNPLNAPAVWYVKRHGIFCCGVANIMMRRVGRKPPGNGGTGAWWAYYGRYMVRYQHGVRLPKGTLLFRRYRNIRDQGHIAIVIGNGYLLQSNPAGGYPNRRPGLNSHITRHASHRWNRYGYYEFMLYPRHWLG